MDIKTSIGLKGKYLGQEFVIYKKLSFFGVDDFFFKGEDGQVNLGFWIEEDTVKKGWFFKELFFQPIHLFLVTCQLIGDILYNKILLSCIFLELF